VKRRLQPPNCAMLGICLRELRPKIEALNDLSTMREKEANGLVPTQAEVVRLHALRDRVEAPWLQRQVDSRDESGEAEWREKWAK